VKKAQKKPGTSAQGFDSIWLGEQYLTPEPPTSSDTVSGTTIATIKVAANRAVSEHYELATPNLRSIPKTSQMKWPACWFSVHAICTNLHLHRIFKQAHGAKTRLYFFISNASDHT
jgi:hypothetical protein